MSEFRMPWLNEYSLQQVKAMQIMKTKQHNRLTNLNAPIRMAFDCFYAKYKQVVWWHCKIKVAIDIIKSLKWK